MSDSQYEFVYENMELSERNRLSSLLDIWYFGSVDERVEKCNAYVSNGLRDELKSVFKDYVSNEKYDELVKINLFYSSDGFR